MVSGVLLAPWRSKVVRRRCGVKQFHKCINFPAGLGLSDSAAQWVLGPEHRPCFSGSMVLWQAPGEGICVAEGAIWACDGRAEAQLGISPGSSNALPMRGLGWLPVLTKCSGIEESWCTMSHHVLSRQSRPTGVANRIGACELRLVRKYYCLLYIFS